MRTPLTVDNLCTQLEQLAGLLFLLSDQPAQERNRVQFESALLLASDMAAEALTAFVKLAVDGQSVAPQQPAEGGSA